MGKKKEKIIQGLINELLEQKVIRQVKYNKSLFLSPIFTVDKANNKHRLILNLKSLNRYVKYHHFKMQTFESALTLIKPGIFMSKLDISNAYYSIPIAPEHQKYLSFRFKDKYYSYTCIPNGLACGPRIYTKLTKPIFSTLRCKGFMNSSYIDDCLLLGDTEEICEENESETSTLLENCGFLLNLEKSEREPATEKVYLGFIIDSLSMRVYLTSKKIKLIERICSQLGRLEFSSIRQVARVIGVLVAAFPAVQYGRLHYRALQFHKIVALKHAHGNFDAIMRVNKEMKSDLTWWTENVRTQFREINKKHSFLEMHTDSSNDGWGCVYQGATINGRWNDQERSLHINCLELLAILYAIKSISHDLRNRNIKVLSDSSTAIAYVNNMGGSKSWTCNQIAIEIWSLCISLNTFVQCEYVPGEINPADLPSRQFTDRHEWELDQLVFEKIASQFGYPCIDLFASRHNAKIGVYASWQPDPNAQFINSLSCDWGIFSLVYLFPPFSLISISLQKIQEEEAEAILIAPIWPNQIWFSRVMHMLTAQPVILPDTATILAHPLTRESHPLAHRIVLMACRLSGSTTRARSFQSKLPASSWNLGEMPPNVNIKAILRNGFYTAVNGRWITFRHL